MSPRSISTLTGSRILLASVWVAALVSIPSAREWQSLADGGAKQSDIVTNFDRVAAFVSISLIASWFSTSRWLAAAMNATKRSSLAPAWAIWSWLVPVVQLWFPRKIVGEILNGDAELPPRTLTTWWLTWLGFLLSSNYAALARLDSQFQGNPIQPTSEIASACMLTASYLIWQRIIERVDSVARAASTPAG